MGSIHSHFFTIFSLCLLFLSSTQLRSKAEGRVLITPKAASFSQTGISESKMMMRAQIGSRPPRCESRCSSCGHCEAIQVPTNPQINHSKIKNSSSSMSSLSNIAYARGDDASNYKPMSWKCKCGNLIFNP